MSTSFIMWSTKHWEEPLSKAKPFNISKGVVVKGFNRVKGNKGAAGVDDESIEDLSRIVNPVLRSWINHYGNYYKIALYPIFDQLNCSLKKWAIRKYKRLGGKRCTVGHWLGRIASHEPRLFFHFGRGVCPMLAFCTQPCSPKRVSA